MSHAKSAAIAIALAATLTIRLDAGDYEQTSTYEVRTDGQVTETEAGEWTPALPEGETDEATVEIRWDDGSQDQITLDGEQWRDLDDQGQLDAFLRAVVLERSSAEAALAATIGA